MNLETLLPDVNRDEKNKTKKLTETEAFVIESLESIDYSTTETFSKAKIIEQILRDEYVKDEEEMSEEEFRDVVIHDHYGIEQHLENLSDDIFELRQVLEILFYINYGLIGAILLYVIF